MRHFHLPIACHLTHPLPVTLLIHCLSPRSSIARHLTHPLPVTLLIHCLSPCSSIACHLTHCSPIVCHFTYPSPATYVRILPPPIACYLTHVYRESTHLSMSCHFTCSSCVNVLTCLLSPHSSAKCQLIHPSPVTSLIYHLSPQSCKCYLAHPSPVTLLIHHLSPCSYPSPVTLLIHHLSPHSSIDVVTVVSLFTYHLAHQ